MNSKKALNLVLLITLLFGCTPNNTRQKKNDAKELEKQAIVESLKVKYDVEEKNIDEHDNWLNLYTIDFKEYMTSHYQILSDFSIHDFYEKDSIKYVKIISDHLLIEILLELELTDENYKLFRENDDKFYNSSIIVYSVSGVRKADFIISALAGPDPSKYEDFDENYFSVALPDPGIDDIFLVKGKLIELVEFK